MPGADTPGAPGGPVAAGYETLRVERDGPVGWLIFDRPGSGNAMDARMLAELERAWTELDADPDVRVIVNTGAGSSFQTGLDVVQLSRDPEALREQSRRTKRAELRISAWHNDVGKPVIAAVNGVCAGGGLHFVADADIVMAAADAVFLDPHVSVGQVSAYEVIALVRKSPMESVTRMALTGRHERIGAARAHQLGVVGEVIDPPERLRAAARDLAVTIAQRPPPLLAATKRALWAALEGGPRYTGTGPGGAGPTGAGAVDAGDRDAGDATPRVTSRTENTGATA